MFICTFPVFLWAFFRSFGGTPVGLVTQTELLLRGKLELDSIITVRLAARFSLCFPIVCGSVFTFFGGTPLCAGARFADALQMILTELLLKGSSNWTVSTR